jgi:hypothetical protein
MVRFFFFLLTIGLLTSQALMSEEEASFEAFKRDVGNAQQRIDYSKDLLKHDELHQYIPESETYEASEGGRKVSEKQKPVVPSSKVESATPSEGEQTADGGHDSTRKREPGAGSSSPVKDAQDAKPATGSAGKSTSLSIPSVRNSSKGLYIAPSLRRSSRGHSVSNTAAVDQPEIRSILFGIRIGTEIDVELVGGASNVQNGLMKFRVNQTVTGDKRSLPVNTLLFARPTAVLGSPRLFTSQTMKGITPDGKEFLLKASIRAEDRQPGLVAYVVNDGKTLYRAASEGKTALADNLLSLAPDGVIVDAGKAAAGQVLQENQSESRAKYGSGVYVVQANPQPAVIEIEETF